MQERQNKNENMLDESNRKDGIKNGAVKTTAPLNIDKFVDFYLTIWRR